MTEGHALQNGRTRIARSKTTKEGHALREEGHALREEDTHCVKKCVKKDTHCVKKDTHCVKKCVKKDTHCVEPEEARSNSAQMAS
jgi:hypothetical protein